MSPRFSKLDAWSGLVAVSFFFPWIEVFGETATGWRLAGLGFPASVLWFVLLALGLMFVLGRSGRLRFQAALGALLGVLTIAGGTVGFALLGTGFFRILKWGGGVLAVGSCALLCASVSVLFRLKS